MPPHLASPPFGGRGTKGEGGEGKKNSPPVLFPPPLREGRGRVAPRPPSPCPLPPVLFPPPLREGRGEGGPSAPLTLPSPPEGARDWKAPSPCPLPRWGRGKSLLASPPIGGRGMKGEGGGRRPAPRMTPFICRSRLARRFRGGGYLGTPWTRRCYAASRVRAGQRTAPSGIAPLDLVPVGFPSGDVCVRAREVCVGFVWDDGPRARR